MSIKPKTRAHFTRGPDYIISLLSLKRRATRIYPIALFSSRDSRADQQESRIRTRENRGEGSIIP